MKTETIIQEVRKVLSNPITDRVDSSSDAFEFEAIEGTIICYFKVTPLFMRKRKGVDVSLDWETEPFLFYDKEHGYTEGPEISEEQMSEIGEELKKIFAEFYLEQEEERIREIEAMQNDPFYKDDEEFEYIIN